MIFNWLVIPTLIFSYLLFTAGYLISKKINDDKKTSAKWLSLGLLFSVPGLLIAFYYLHLFDDSKLFYQYRSIPFTELSASGAGFFAGIIAGLSQKVKILSIFSNSGLLIILTLGIALPHAKPFINPANYNNFVDKWDGRVCRQSTSYSCGAASAATMIKYYGIETSELEIAKECFTYSGGTENWYIARALRKRGIQAKFIISKSPTQSLIPVPCIAGVTLGKVGHFIAILEDKGDEYVVGDPLEGEKIYSKANIYKNFSFTGFFMSIKKQH